MKLLTNLGNSDLSLIYENPELRDDIYRNKTSFSTSIRDLKEEIRKSKTVFNEDGMVLDNSLSFHSSSVKQLKMEILKTSINEISSKFGKPIDTVFCFCTKQEPSNETDTFNFSFLLKGNFGKCYFPNIKFFFFDVTCNPADYKEAYNYYNKFFEEGKIIDKENEGEFVVSISQGTPAMSYSLSSVVSKFYPSIPQFYTSQVQVKKTEVKKLYLFSNKEINRQIVSYCNYLKEGSYKSAADYLNSSFIKKVKGLAELTKYYDARSKYSFDSAYDNVLVLKKENESLFNIVEKSITGLNKFSNLTLYKEINGKKIEYFDYLNPDYIILLFETLQNVKFNYKKGDYLLSIAFMTSFLDCINICFIAKAANIKEMYYNGNENYVKLNDFCKKNIFPCSKKNYKDLNNKWNNEILTTTGPVISQLIKWFSKQENALPFIKELAGYQLKNNNFQAFRSLRNKLPIAHSMDSVGESKINESLHGLSFDDFLDGFVKILKVANTDFGFDCYYHEIIDDIQQELEKQLLI